MSEAKLPIPDLAAALTALLQQIPPGRVTTYGDLAEALGDVKAAKWVAAFLLDHAHAGSCPCFRVIRRTGEPGGFIDRTKGAKEKRLKREGIAIREGQIDLQRFGFADFVSNRPLAALAKLQDAIPARVSFDPLREVPDHVAGVDVSYAGESAFAAYVVVETATGRLIHSHVRRCAATFPYVTGYLAFRELPALSELMETVPPDVPRADVVFVDGNGVLHPRGAGIATHFGVHTGLRTIGIGKKLLCGKVEHNSLRPGESRNVAFRGRTVGAAVVSEPHSRPIFVSVGQQMTLPDAVRLTRLCFRGHRLPEPLYHADRLSRRAAKEHNDGMIAYKCAVEPESSGRNPKRKRGNS